MKKVRIGFIGAGWWATTNHIPLLAKRTDVELAGVCRLGADMLQTVKEKFGFPFATEDYHELLKQNLDGVVVTSPTMCITNMRARPWKPVATLWSKSR